MKASTKIQNRSREAGVKGRKNSKYGYMLASKHKLLPQVHGLSHLAVLKRQGPYFSHPN